MSEAKVLICIDLTLSSLLRRLVHELVGETPVVQGLGGVVPFHELLFALKIDIFEIFELGRRV